MNNKLFDIRAALSGGACRDQGQSMDTHHSDGLNRVGFNANFRNILQRNKYNLGGVL